MKNICIYFYVILCFTAKAQQNKPINYPNSTYSDSLKAQDYYNTKNAFSTLVTRGPYLQLPTPAGIQVRWNTNMSEKGKVCYSSLGAISVSNPGTCISESSNTTNHVIDLNGLLANTSYFYSIENTTNTFFEGTNEHRFKTPPLNFDNTKITRIWVTGDPSEGTQTPVQASVLNGFQLFKNSNNIPALDLWLLLGDNAYENGLELEYDAKFFSIFNASPTNIMKQTPILPCIGNHDYYSNTFSEIIEPQKSMLNYKNQISGSLFDIFGSSGANNRKDNRIYKNNAFFNVFSLPSNGYGGKYATEESLTKKAYYSYNHNNIHFVCLDSYGFYDDYLLYADLPDFPSITSNNPQMNWLIEDLDKSKMDSTIAWTIMFWHHPPYTRGGGHFSDNVNGDSFIMKGIRERLVKYLDNANYKIDLVLNGHSHAYERSRLMKNHHEDEAYFNPPLNTNPFLTSINSNANSNGAFDNSITCPYVKSRSNIENEGVVYVVTGSSGQVYTSPSNVLKGHFALNGASFNYPTVFDRGTIEDSQGGSFYLEIMNNRLDAKFINESGIVADKFSILKDVNNLTSIAYNIRPEGLNTPSNIKIVAPYFFQNGASISGPTISGFQSFVSTTSELYAEIINPHIGPTYTISEPTGCVNQNIRFHFDENYCWPNVTVNNFIDSPVPERIKSFGIIHSSSTINEGSKVFFEAENSIKLTPFFNAMTGSLFESSIVPSLMCPSINP